MGEHKKKGRITRPYQLLVVSKAPTEAPMPPQHGHGRGLMKAIAMCSTKMAEEDQTSSSGTEEEEEKLKGSPGYRLTVPPDHIFWQQVALKKWLLGNASSQ